MGCTSPQERVIASLAPGSRIAEPSVGIERSGPTDLVHHPLAACDYCGWPTSIGAIPTAAADGPTDWSIDQPVPATSDAPAPAWPWPDGHGARAPPSI
jgi:hypothetical protein